MSDPPADLIRLDAKEVDRADGEYSVVVRPQSGGGYLVSGIRLIKSQGMLLGKAFRRRVKDQSEIKGAVAEVVRWMDKMGMAGTMGDASRDRQSRK